MDMDKDISTGGGRAAHTPDFPKGRKAGRRLGSIQPFPEISAKGHGSRQTGAGIVASQCLHQHLQPCRGAGHRRGGAGIVTENIESEEAGMVPCLRQDGRLGRSHGRPPWYA